MVRKWLILIRTIHGIKIAYRTVARDVTASRQQIGGPHQARLMRQGSAKKLPDAMAFRRPVTGYGQEAAVDRSLLLFLQRSE